MTPSQKGLSHFISRPFLRCENGQCGRAEPDIMHYLSMLCKGTVNRKPVCLCIVACGSAAEVWGQPQSDQQPG